MTPKALEPSRDYSRRRTRPVPGELSTIVARGRLAVAQLRQESREAATSASTGGAAVARKIRQGGQGQQKGVAARATAGNSATGVPFMDIGAVRVACPAPPLGIAFDGADSFRIAFPVVGTIVRVFLPIAAILSALGGLSRLGLAPGHSANPLPPPGSLPAAGLSAVLCTESILGPRHEASPATFQEADAPFLLFSRRRS
jgi:hypothetical protein